MTTAVERRISPVFLGIAAVTAVAGWAVWAGPGAPSDGSLRQTVVRGLLLFVFVTAGWIVSLCLHEYAHARTALHSGDLSVGAKGYLTLNPLKYTHAVLSILLPVLFLVMGGIGLPGGAVFIERHRISGRWRHSLISAAGPLTNVLFAVVCTAPFWLGLMDGVPFGFRFALAFLAMLQVTAAILNFLPVPGLDGYGVLEPWLSGRVRRQIAPFAPYGIIALFILLFEPSVNQAFFGLVDGVLDVLGVSEAESSCGRDLYRFWQEPNPGCERLLGLSR